MKTFGFHSFMRTLRFTLVLFFSSLFSLLRHETQHTKKHKENQKTKATQRVANENKLN